MKKRYFLVFPILLVVAFIVTVARDDPQKAEPAAITNPVVGLVTEASEANISIRTKGGVEVVFVNGAHDLPVEHLKEHQADSEPVTITWQAKEGKKIATRVDDAL